MKVGMTLPQFDSEAAPLLRAATEAERLRLDGIFIFDHLWPMGSPDRPVLAALPAIGAALGVTSDIRVGSLVMRVGLVPDEVLIEEMTAVHELSEGRFICGLGTGDRLSAAENQAYGIAYAPAAERRQSLLRCASELAHRGLEVWIGTGAAVAPATREVAVRIGAAVNVWNTGVAAVADEAELDVTWGGPIPGGPLALRTTLTSLQDAGATWAVCAWPESIPELSEAVHHLRSR